MIKIRAVIEHITYQNSENGYSILKGKVKDHNDLVTLVGTMLEVPVGSVLLCEGDWKIDRKYGQQFIVQSFEEVMPATVYGIEKYKYVGYVHSVTFPIKTKDGTIRTTQNTQWTPLGVKFLYDTLKEHGALPIEERGADYVQPYELLSSTPKRKRKAE